MPIDRDARPGLDRRFAAEMAEHRDELAALDTAIGDGDHGTNMDRGMRKALEKLDAAEQADIGAVLKTVAMALVSSVGGAAGPLYGTLLPADGQRRSRAPSRSSSPTGRPPGAGLEGVQARGKAEPGDKTMVDALVARGRGARAGAPISTTACGRRPTPPRRA